MNSTEDFHVIRMMKILNKKSFELEEMILLMCDVDEIRNPKKEVKISYTKQYFARYYGIDKDTFNKWIPVFCPDLWNDKYKSKRKFSKQEVVYIYQNLGRYSKSFDIPRNHKGIGQFLHSSKKWKKSRIYQEIKLEMENRFPEVKIDFHIFPPTFVTALLKEEIENLNLDNSKELGPEFEQNVANMKDLMKRHGAMSEREKSIKLRWIFRHFK